MVEMVGVEPTSENTSPLLSTSVSAELISPRKALSSAASFGQFLNCQWAGTTPNDRSLLSWTSALSQQVNPRGRAAAIELRWLSYIKLLKQLTPYDNQLFDYLLRLNLSACFLKWPAHLPAYNLSVSPSKPLHPLSNNAAHYRLIWRRMRRSASRFAMLSRLSYCFLPLAKASSSFTLPFLK